MHSDDWREVEIPGDSLEFSKLERYQLTDSVTGARFLITLYEGPNGGTYSLAELQNSEDFDQDVKLALEFGPTDGHFGGRKDNLNDTLKKVWNNIQRAHAVTQKRKG